MSERRRQLRAFTMLELILSMGMVAMLAMSLYASMRVGMRARRTAMAAVQPVRASTIAMDMICHDLESVLPPTGVLAGPFLGARQMGPSGDADYLGFYCLGSEGDQPRLPVHEGVRQVELMLRTDVAPPTLVRRVTRNLLARAQVEPNEEVLCRNVRSFTVQYFDGTTWLSEWDSTSLGDVLPFAVQIQLEIEPAADASPEALPNRIVRIVPLACAKLGDVTGTGGTGGTSGGTGATTGGTGTSGTRGAGGRS